jgi:hypothetical protein
MRVPIQPPNALAFDVVAGVEIIDLRGYLRDER